jgi:hypothetical protein
VRIGWDDGDIHVRIGSHRAALRFFTCLQNGPHFETSVDPVCSNTGLPVEVRFRRRDTNSGPISKPLDLGSERRSLHGNRLVDGKETQTRWRPRLILG